MFSMQSATTRVKSRCNICALESFASACRVFSSSSYSQRIHQKQKWLPSLRHTKETDGSYDRELISVSEHTNNKRYDDQQYRRNGSKKPTVLDGEPSGRKFASRGPASFKFNVPRSTVVQLMVRECDALIQKTLKNLRYNESLELKAWGCSSAKEFKDLSSQFKKALDTGDGESAKEIQDHLHDIYTKQGIKGVATQLRFKLIGFITESRFSRADMLHQRKIADLRYPIEWYPATRALQRKIHLHVGPTNSGKTYQALQRLEQAKSGLYAGPLRLLAHEVYTRLNAKGKKCALLTGEERRYPEGYDQVGNFQMISCTVEMIPVNTNVDVAVIDEIQMIGDNQRGWAWTQALLAVKAKEVHLCGELRTVPLIRDICASIGDELIVHEYKRLSPLQVMDKSIAKLKDLEKGDAVIVFSRVGIHEMKKSIEKATGKRCAVVYGSLPPETRAQQAALFNDPDNEYDFIVASDAIGMGLNLSIKRVVFEATSKHNGTEHTTLEIPALKQIAGRAGRFRTADDANKNKQAKTSAGALDSKPAPAKSVGLVTSLERFDLPVIKRAMQTEPPPMETAGILPPDSIISRFAAYFPPGTPFSYILLRLHEISTVHKRFHLCVYSDQLAIADAIQEFDISIADKLIFIAAPMSMRDPSMMIVSKALAKCLADQSGGELLDIPEINLGLLDQKGTGLLHLKALEGLHKALTLYLWLSYRFAGVFRSQALAFHVKGILESRIDDSLAEVEISKEQRTQMKLATKKAAEATLRASPKEAANTSMASDATPVEGEAELLVNIPLIEEPNRDLSKQARTAT